MTQQKEKKPINWKKEIIEWVLTFVIPVVVAMLIHNYLFTFARVDGESMLDTFHTNNITGVSRLHYRINEPQRGEVITCHYDETAKLYVKRIIALPGDEVVIHEGVTYVNGVPRDEEYVHYRDHEDFGPYIVEEGCVFVMGDNRANSHDSRAEGAIPEDLITGRVFAVLFPAGEAHFLSMT